MWDPTGSEDDEAPSVNQHRRRSSLSGSESNGHDHSRSKSQDSSQSDSSSSDSETQPALVSSGLLSFCCRQTLTFASFQG